MSALTAPQTLPIVPPAADRSSSVRAVRILIWTYLVLLVVEGALRKWALPRFSDPLLIIRDPVVLGIYIFAMRARLFRLNAYLVSVGVIALLAFIATIITLYPYLPLQVIFLVDGYGFRSDFLHLPLIFVMAEALDLEDVKKIGRWTLLLAVPIAALMVLQFKASPDSFINKTVGLGEGMQLSTAGGKIRPPATFSFIAGPIFYLSATAAFVIYGALNRAVYPAWLLLAGSGAVVTGVIVSGSRGCVLAVGLVALAILVILVVRPSAMNKIAGTLLALAVVGFLVGLFASRLPFLKEGMDVLSERFTTSAEAAETTVVGGLVERVIDGFTEPFKYVFKIPLTGYGLGLGTSGGARFLVGQGGLLFSENEWIRIIAESGAILGLGFIIWRIALTVKLFIVSLRALKAGEVLSVLLFATALLGTVNGQLGQPTTLGFTMALAGLCLAAANFSEDVTNAPESQEQFTSKRLPRRSPYAERIHGGAIGPDHTNGSVDR